MAEPLMTAQGVRLDCAAADRTDAIRQAGELLIELGAVEPAYAEAMQERELVMSSYVGEGFALPHGTDAARVFVHRPTLVFLQYPEGIDWEGDDVRACVAIAAKQDEHVSVMAALARVLVDPAQAEELRTTDDPERVLTLLAPQASSDPASTQE